MKQGLSNINEDNCYEAVIQSVFKMLINGKSTSFIQKYINISENALNVMRKTSSKDITDLVNLIIARKSIRLKVDTQSLLSVIHSFNHLLPSEISYFMGLHKAISSDVSYFKPVYHQYINFINDVVAKCLRMDNKNVNSFGVTNSVICEMMDLKAVYIPALELALLNKNVIQVDVDELSLNTCLAAYIANVESKDLVLKLIKCGANHSFIKQYNGRIDVSSYFVKKWREIYNVNNQEECISVKNGVDIWNDFNLFMSQRLSTIDVYLQLNRKYKLRIDTIYLFVASSIKSELLLSDDDDDDVSIVLSN
jgi:hypothetical protein